MPAPPAGTTWRSPLAKSVLIWGSSTRPQPLQPITTADYPTPAERPAYSLLDCTATRAALDLNGEHWQQALKAVLQQAKTP